MNEKESKEDGLDTRPSNQQPDIFQKQIIKH